MWHQDVLPASARGALADLRQVSLLTGFYLAGGTALALRLGHRRSRDLDFFSGEEFAEDTLLAQLQDLTGLSVLAKAPHSLHVILRDTRVSFLFYPYPLLFPCQAYCGVEVADVRDIACMKISAIASRGVRRDFVDLYAVSQLHPLQELVALFQRKFARASYSLVHILKSLTYFEDAEKDPFPEMLAPLDWEELKRFFAAEGPRLL